MAAGWSVYLMRFDLTDRQQPSALKIGMVEEVGRTDLPIGPCIGRRGGTFPMGGRWFTQYERWYLSRCQHFDVDRDLVARLHQEGIRDMRWWSPEELKTEQIRTGPRTLASLLRRVRAGHLPDPTTDLGF